MQSTFKAKILNFSATASIIASITSPALANEQWIFTALPYLPGSAMTSPAAINNSGIIAGTSFGSPERAIIVRDGEINEASASLGARFQSFGRGINDAGQIVGSGYPDGSDAFYGPTAVFWDGTGIRKLGNLPGGRDSAATDINDKGEVVGYSDAPPTYGLYRETHAVMWGTTGIVDLGGLFKGADSQANAINNFGQVVGYSDFNQYRSDEHATLWNQGNIIDLSAGSQYSSEAYDINDLGQIVGVENQKAVLWQDGKKFVLGGLENSTGSVASGINSLGWIVGTRKYNNDWRATLWRDNVAIDLNSLTAVAESGWRIQTALDINDRGEIVGVGVYSAPNGNFYQGFLLSPVPEPTTAVYMLIGILGLLVVANRNKQAHAAMQRNHQAWVRTLRTDTAA